LGSNKIDTPTRNTGCCETGAASAGIEFIDENGGGPGVRLHKRQRSKKAK
jgi:hypothetical protein